MVNPDPRFTPPFPPAPPIRGEVLTLADYLALAPVKQLAEDIAKMAADHLQDSQDRGFNMGLCVALQVLHKAGRPTEWVELIKATGENEILQYATFVEPEEWELAGFADWAPEYLRLDKPKRHVVRRRTP